MALGNGSYEIIVAADDTEEGEMASELLGGVGVLVFTCWPPRPVEVEFG
jgi:hypothetical protein